MNKNFKQIVRCLVNAQVASNGGKGIYDIAVSPFEKDIARGGYIYKDDFISRAISLINSTRNCGIYYYVAPCPELSDWNDCFIVYFNIRVNGKRYQCSFHSFNSRLENLVGGPTTTRWSRKDSSRDVLKELRDLIEM